VGLDAMIIEGRAKSPVYLWIHDQDCEILDAQKIWGTTTGETEVWIKKTHEDKLIRVCSIGQAGENKVRFACIINDMRNAAGRTGMGAVMGSKNLKAIAIRGLKKPNLSNRNKIKLILDDCNEAFKQTAAYFSFGTGGDLIDSFAKSGNLPTRNFRDGNFAFGKDIDPKKISETFGLKRDICYACPIRCKKVIGIEEPIKVNPLYGGPEYETIASFGSNCGISDMASICKANELCNKYSLDTISTGVVISYFMECSENGLIDDNEVKPKFGDTDSMLKLIEMIPHREGIGDILAEGVKKAATFFGEETFKYAIHVKGQEIPMHEPRLKQGLGVGYAVSPTGAEHMTNFHDTSIVTNAVPSLGVLEPLELNDLGYKKVGALISFSNWRVVENSLMLCHFNPYSVNQETTLLGAVTGWDITTWELMKLGERITNMARVFNIRQGFETKDDKLPSRFFESHTSGELSKIKIEEDKFQKAIDSYYEMMGWSNQGIPTISKLASLDLDWLI
jgi:aldehyde:ferredoxin oxidoreductase